MHYEVHLLHPHSVQIYMFFVLIIFGRKKAPLSPFSLQQTINARRALSIIQNTLNAASEADTVRTSIINYELCIMNFIPRSRPSPARSQDT